MMRGPSSRQVAAGLALLGVLVMSSAFRCGGRERRTQAAIDLDAMVTAKVRENLTAASPGVRATDIGVSTFDLVVTLDGQVRSEAERTQAVQIARDTQVVKEGATHRVAEVKADGLKVKPE